MRYRITALSFALALALALASWAQTAKETATSIPQQNNAPVTQPKSSCCDKMAADSKDGQKSCPRHGKTAADGKDTASCCSGTDAKSCMKDEKAAAACCADCSKSATTAKCCDKSDKQCGKDCCSRMKSEKPA